MLLPKRVNEFFVLLNDIFWGDKTRKSAFILFSSF